jgi:hypothetical protein
VTSADQPHIREGMVKGAAWARGNDCGEGAGEAGATVEARRFDGFREGQVGQDDVRDRAYMRLCAPGEAQAADVVVSVPAAASPVTPWLRRRALGRLAHTPTLASLATCLALAHVPVCPIDLLHDR